ncbi:ArfGap-domain-containing protein [Imleria badia]|nr:ArfGap-domain-containing protein [Imleria badia]
MYKPDKATTERNAKILRELIKQPDNKLCADCKRNDPRWASWNLGVYLCIRCSGIHRGMGTHISRVKSIDLDMWTPEQMESIQKWGNRRANLYWEAHLKAGHIPPDHKMESFIRSKYETRRWAIDGPPPLNPSVLEGPAESASNGDAVAATVPLFDTSARPTHAPSASLSVPRPASPSVHSPSTFRQNTAFSHSQSRQLLSAAVAGRVQVPSAPSQSQSQSQPQQQQQQQQQQKPENDLFSLDFHTPPVSKLTPPQPPTKDVKQDILSLFSAAPAAPAQSIQPSNAFGQFASSWDAHGQTHGRAPSQAQAQQQPISMVGTTGTGQWGVSSGWSGALPNTTPSANIWGAPANGGTSASTLNALNTTDIWGGSAAQASGGHGLFGGQTALTQASKKDDVFGDLWGDFK